MRIVYIIVVTPNMKGTSYKAPEEITFLFASCDLMLKYTSITMW